MVRAFIAIELDPEVVKKIRQTIDDLKSRIRGVRWSPAANLHLTVKFLGDVAEGQIDAIGEALAGALRPFPRFTINAKGLGVFPDLRRPRILWVGLMGEQLAALAASVELSLLPLGFAPESRNFAPHLTIGRWRQLDRPPRTLKQELEVWRDCEFGHSTVEQVVLFQSVLKPEGAVYSRLKTVALHYE
ncbi:MAG: RNA 2',3'-cyclic phosphodiesterase [Chloroflexota bacterium]